jgi:Pvc16 N-terminal domain
VIRDLDLTIRELLETRAPSGSELAGADVVFDLPDADWRAGLGGLTVDCYLYDLRENAELRTEEPLVRRSADGTRAARLRPPARIDCSYCITAWSTATDEPVLEEHRVLGQVVRILLANPTIPEDVLQGSLATQIPPYPTIIAAADGIRNQPDFWDALDQQLKPSLNYVVTLAMLLDDELPEAELAPVVQQVEVEGRHLAELA